MLQRAVVLIGVSRTGGLPQLTAVPSGLEKVRAWAESQPGMTRADGTPRVTLITDGDGKTVTAKDVREAVKVWVDDSGIDQLIVYFAGHGANVRYSEFWLLTGAPDDPNEAVNVRGSNELARQCGIPHVVLISDACRTVAASIQSQSVLGSLVFPNPNPSASPGCVDMFYASMIGKPALEVSDPNAAAGFNAIYTSCLVDGLMGQAPADPIVENGQLIQRVKPWPLHRYLREAIPDRLTQLGTAIDVTQNPDAIITSQPEAWLAQILVVAGGRPSTPAAAPGPGLPRRATRGPMRPSSPGVVGPAAPTRGESLMSVSAEAIRSALAAPPGAPRPARAAVHRGIDGPGSLGVEKLFAASLGRIADHVAPEKFESACGFQVIGIGIRDAIAGAGRLEILDAAKGLARIWDAPKPATNALVVFEDGRGALIPLIPDFIASLAYDREEGELMNVTYEPSRDTSAWHSLQWQLPSLRELRRVVATATSLGAFRPDRIEGLVGFINRLREVKGLDPTMAVYAAYALHALQQRIDIEEMQAYLRSGIGLTIFDVAMLSRSSAAEPAMLPDAFPATPMLAQGWTLLDAFGVSLPKSLQGRLYGQLESSLWTLFKPAGVELIRAAIESKEIP